MAQTFNDPRLRKFQEYKAQKRKLAIEKKQCQEKADAVVEETKLIPEPSKE